MLNFDLLYCNINNMVGIVIGAPAEKNGIKYAIVRANKSDKIAMYELHYFLRKKAYSRYAINGYTVYLTADYNKIIIK